jgi:hypothetical protein
MSWQDRAYKETKESRDPWLMRSEGQATQTLTAQSRLEYSV